MKLITYNVQYAPTPGLSLAMLTDMPVQYLLATQGLQCPSLI